MSLLFLDACIPEKVDQDDAKRLRNYPAQVHKMLRDQMVKKTSKSVGEWSAWSPWSTCSRTCGGGITQQVRHCINRPADSRFIRKQRRKRQYARSSGCVGLYKRIHLCNSQECPNRLDFRSEQCSAFNNRPFKGKFYIWQPILKANDECTLNCRPEGENFYATLNKAVIDGTLCNYPMTSMGQMAPRGTRGVCVDGYCKSVNSHGVIGGVNDTPEECAACQKGSCRSVNGIYTRPDLPQGYSLVAQVPKGACRILIQQLKHTRNYIALKNSNGSFIVNGDWKFSNSRVVEGAGTKFTYIKQDGSSLETISSTGPLANNLDIMIVNYQANAGIKYGYSLPITDDQPLIAPPLLRKPQPDDQPHQIETRRLETPSINTTFAQRDEAIRPHHHRRTRLRRKYFQWKITGLTACSKTCGGGVQTYVRQCVRETAQQTAIPVNEKRCSHTEAPPLKPIRCNVENCPPDWDGYWTECSTTCGDGVQQYKYHCKHDLTAGGNVIVNEQQCVKPKPPSLSRTCRRALCDNISDNELVPATPAADVRIGEWSVGLWTPCSVSCGSGYKTRSVNCPSGQCSTETRPKHVEHCETQPCVKSAPTTTPAPSNWLLTEWSQCSESCGTGTQTRLSVCVRDDCESNTKPETSRACSSERQCNGQWFTGPWGPCSDSCSGKAKQKREIYCIAKIRGQSHITNEMTCAAHLKPNEEQSCSGSCPPHWFVGDWGVCEGPCSPNGVQHREVKCLEADGKPSNGCKSEDIPATRRNCACFNRHEEKYIPAQDEPNDRTCVDRNYKCKLVVQARLCKYPYYKSYCCESCRRAPQDDVQE